MYHLKCPLLPNQIISVNMEHPTIKAFYRSLKIKCDELRWKKSINSLLVYSALQY